MMLKLRWLSDSRPVVCDGSDHTIPQREGISTRKCWCKNGPVWAQKEWVRL